LVGLVLDDVPMLGELAVGYHKRLIRVFGCGHDQISHAEERR
jgi:hypothetical protein